MGQPTVILLVEDEPDEARLVEIALAASDIDHELHSVADGEAALAHLRAPGLRGDRSRPDLVLLDVHLPGMSGYDVLDVIRATPSIASLRVVVMTSETDRWAAARGRRHGADAVAHKPITTDDLSELVHSSAGRRS